MDKFKLPKPTFDFLFYMEINQKGDIAINDDGEKEVLLSPIVGGVFAGDKLSGKVAPIGTQYCAEKDGFTNHLECLLLLETEDNEQILMNYKGIALFTKEQQNLMKKAEYVDPSEYYYRYQIEFKTGSKKYDWLNNKICIAVIGVPNWETVCFDVYMIN